MNDVPARTEITDEQREYAANALRGLPFSKLIGMELVDLRPDEAMIKIEMRDDLRQPSGVLHGGVTAALIDTAMAFAVRTRLGLTEATTTINLTVHYLRPHVAGTFICTAKIVRAGKRIFTVSAEVVNEQQEMIATAIATFTRV